MSARTVRAPRGSALSCRGWIQEAAMRMLMNNLDPDVAERPDDLVVYGGTGKAARSWEAFDAIVAALRELEQRHPRLDKSAVRFEVVSEGDTDTVSHMVPKDLLEELQAKDAVRSLFPLDYFSNMVKAISSAPTVALYLGTDYPVRMEFKIAAGKGEVKYLLAPRIESD